MTYAEVVRRIARLMYCTLGMSSVGLIRIFSPSHGIVVEITNAVGPAKTLIAVMEKNHTYGGYVKTSEIRISGKKEILIDLIEEQFLLNEAIADVLDSGSAQVTGQAIADFVHEVGDNGEVFVERPVTVYALMDFAIVVRRNAIIKATFPNFRMVPSMKSSKKHDVVETKVQIIAVPKQTSGKIVEIERPIQVHMASSRDVSVFRSKEWFHLHDPDTELLEKTLTFRLSNFIRFGDDKILGHVETLGQVLVELPTDVVTRVAHQHPVAFNFDDAFSLNAKTEVLIKVLASNGRYARVPGGYNPIHDSRTFSSYTNLAEIITHRMFSSAEVEISF
ncbi:hypothetical protein HOY82DRAFT_617714 [Tuber indicum]|nr:hypothetical protein HOY82DRAFT_617714 [Tuber indicum]